MGRCYAGAGTLLENSAIRPDSTLDGVYLGQYREDLRVGVRVDSTLKLLTSLVVDGPAITKEPLYYQVGGRHYSPWA